MDPAEFVPLVSADFIGPARTIALMLEAKAKALLETKCPMPVKLLLYGAPGVAKTRLMEMFARLLAWHTTAIESVNGRNVTSDVVRRWQESACYIPMGGRFSIKLLNELDTMPEAAQTLLLSYLDEMPKFTVFLGTSNLQLLALSERFETRLQQFRVSAPSTEEIAAFLCSRWKINKQRAMEISVGAAGNCRAALLDAQSVLDVERVAA